MEYKEAGSETHQQEHRFESPRAARQNKATRRTVLARKGSLRRAQRALAHSAPFCIQSISRRAAPAGTQIPRVMEFSKTGGPPARCGYEIYLDISSLLMEAPE